MNSLQPLFRPRTIAVLGASARGGRGTKVVQNLRDTGFEGDVFPVNPGYDDVLGYKCFPSIAALPSTPDCVVAAIGAEKSCDALEEAYARGTRAAVVLAAGFGEGGHGDDRGRRLRALSAGGMAISGPNCHGVLNVRDKVAAYGGEVPVPPKSGSVALVSQSGGLTRNAFIPLMTKRGVGFNYVVSCGNQLGVSVEDYIEYFLADDQVTTVAAHIESLRNPAKLRALALDAHRRAKTIIMFQTGRSAAGQQLVQSHTGAIVSDAKVFSAFLRRCGIVQVDYYEEFVECIELFAHAPARDQLGAGVAVISGSGGGATVAADVLADVGTPLAVFNTSTHEKIKAALPDFGTVSNPIDATGSVYSDTAMLPKLIDAVLTDPDRPIAAAALPIPRAQIVRFADAIAQAARATGRTVVAYQASPLGETLYPEVVETLHGASVPIILGVSNAMRCLKYLTRRQDLRERALTYADAAPAPRIEPQPRINGSSSFLELRAAMAALEVPIVPSSFADSEDAAVAIAREFNAPVAIKAESPGLTHKSDAGGVKLNCATADEVRAAFRAVNDGIRAHGFTPQGVVVQPMIEGIAEAYAGVVNDKVYGPVVSFGLGGIFIETLDDVTMEAAPLTPAEAERMIEGIKGFRVLDGARGRPRADIGALAQLLVRLSQFATAYAGQFRALDLNPIIVKSDGAVAVDIALEA